MSDSKFESEHEDYKTIAGWMIALLWVLVLGGGTWLAQGWLDNRREARAPRWETDAYGQQELIVQSDRLGHYELTGSVNGMAVRFLVDTGATGISIPQAAASQLNLERGRAFEVVTANGTARVYATRLDSLTIGPFVQQGISAHINPAMDGDMALLGMEFLRHYDLLQRAGELTISYPGR